MTKTELRKMRKNKLLELAAKEGVRLPEKVLKPELIDILYRHFRKKEAKGEKKSSPKKSKKKAAAGRKKKQRSAGDEAVPEAAAEEENGRTIRQKAVSGKYYLEQESGKVVLKEEEAQIPSYDLTRIVTMVRDPRCIFSYWNISSKDMEKLAGSFGGDWSRCRLVLRVYTLGLNGERTAAFDVDISPENDNWYIDVYPDTRYQVGIGAITPHGVYSEIALSGEVRTPRESVSDREDAEWARPQHLIDRIISASGDISYRAGAGRGTSGMPHRPLSSENITSPGDPRAAGRRTYVNAELIIRGVAGDDTTITLYGNEVIPREDGSFTIRMNLPDGEVEIPIRLSSGGGRVEKDIVATVKTRKP